jgi:hypothetical protein
MKPISTPCAIVMGGQRRPHYLAGRLWEATNGKAFAGGGRAFMLDNDTEGDWTALEGDELTVIGDRVVIERTVGGVFDLIDVQLFPTNAERDTWIQLERDEDARDLSEARHTRMQESCMG